MLTAVATLEHTILETTVGGIAVVIISQLWLAAAFHISLSVPILHTTIIDLLGYGVNHCHHTLPRLVH